MLSVVTWNVENLFRPEPPAAAATQKAYRRKVEKLAAVIRDSGAELVALQEVGSLDALNDLMAELGADWRPSKVRAARSSLSTPGAGGDLLAARARPGCRLGAP